MLQALGTDCIAATMAEPKEPVRNGSSEGSSLLRP